MKKINTFSHSVGKSLEILTTSQMLVIRGGMAIDDAPCLSRPSKVGPISATADDKRRDRPGGGISTH
jgi:hypothetical protein